MRTPTILDLIGNTPIIQAQALDTGPCTLFFKLENRNPNGSLKDRIAHYMITAAEQAGQLKPHSVIVEATAGNTGISLTQIALLKGYKAQLVIPDKMSQEKINQVRAMGAEVIITPSNVSKNDPDYYQNKAAHLAQTHENAYYINQFNNENNSKAHECTTAPEIWAQMEHKLDAIVCGSGTGGHITGISRFMEKTAPHVELVLADPVGSVLADYVKTGVVTPQPNARWLVEGIGSDYIPKTCDLSRVTSAFSISDADSFSTAYQLLRREGIFAGSSSGTTVCAALRYCQAQTQPKRVLALIYDGGAKYLSKMYNPQWLEQQGFDIEF